VILILAGGEVFTPAPAGAATVLALNGAIARVGSVDTTAVETLGVPSRFSRRTTVWSCPASSIPTFI
jgi:hypothetical protein